MKNKKIVKRASALISKERTQLGLSLKDVGAEMGITYQQIQKYEKGRSSLTLERWHELAKILRIDPRIVYEDSQDGFSDITKRRNMQLIRDYSKLPANIQKNISEFCKELAKQGKKT